MTNNKVVALLYTLILLPFVLDVKGFIY